MAVSHSHKFCQIIGDTLEMAVEPFIKEFAKKYKLFFDKKGPRHARPGTKLTWIDINGNKHDLDFVLEKDGTNTKIGVPVAFIECAWRRYTKHSRNKAQEIQGAIIPLFEKYKKNHPFIGVILAGEFTENSLIQLKSLGFSVLFFPYDKIVKAFQTVGVEAYFNENTKEKFFADQVSKWESLDDKKKKLVYKEIINLSFTEINAFILSLQLKIDREIKIIRLWVMFGKQYIFDSINKAKEFIVVFSNESVTPEFNRYEAEIEYSNGDVIKVNFQNKSDLLTFLSSFM